MTEVRATPINATLVKELRHITGAGVIACKNALVETQGDLEAAIERLRVTETAKAESKAARAAAEGLVALVVDGTCGAIVELNAETDFVARNETFRDTAAALASIALSVHGDHAAVLNAPAPDGGGRVSDSITRLAARTGERVNLRRSGFLSIGQGVVASYVHNCVAPGMGSIGVLLALESPAGADALREIGHRIAMHVAASSPLWVSREEIPAEVVAAKRDELSEQARKTGKPREIVETMVTGRMRKFFAEVALGLQPFVLNPDQEVNVALREAEAAIGASIVVKGFIRFRTGEGLDNSEGGIVGGAA